MIPVVIRNVKIGEGIPKICVPIVGKTKEEIVEAARNIVSLPMDVIEWRGDWYTDILDYEEVEVVLAELRGVLKDKPILFTFRTKKEGGEKLIESIIYLELIKRVIDTGYADIVDVEMFSMREVVGEIIGYAHGKGVKVIASNHDFEKTPAREEIVDKLIEMDKRGADVLKIAVMPQCQEDVKTLMVATSEMLNKTEKPIVSMSMSEMGKVSRVSGEAFGSTMTFGSVGQASAPGQIPVEELKITLEEFHKALIKKG